MSVLALPPRESCIRRVNLLFLYGIKSSPSVSAAMTLPKAASDWLMLVASLSCSLLAWVFDARSEPARSISDNLPNVVFFVALLRFSTTTPKMECDRLLSLFIAVELTCLFLFACSKRF